MNILIRRWVGALLSGGIMIGLMACTARAATTVTTFTVDINGTPITSTTRVAPVAPIMATCWHPNPQVTRVKMQHPSQPNLFLMLSIGKPTRLSNHEGHMQAGHDSTSVFIALDAAGREHGRVMVTFAPRRR